MVIDNGDYYELSDYNLKPHPQLEDFCLTQLPEQKYSS